MHELPVTSYHSPLTPNITGKEQPKHEATLGQPPQPKKHTLVVPPWPNLTIDSLPKLHKIPNAIKFQWTTWTQKSQTEPEVRFQGLIYLSRIFPYIS